MSLKLIFYRKYFQNVKILNKSFLSTSSILNAKVAVVLSGCGCNDGSEIHEASACLVHLSRGKADVAVFAPDIDQYHVIDHVKGMPMEGEKRNVLKESARIARGQIQPITSLRSSIFDAVIFPGGFGAAKNLSSFAFDGPKFTVDKEVERVLKDFHSSKKPIGLCCIAPILAAKVLKGCEVTLGFDKQDDQWPHSGACAVVRDLGSKHVDCSVVEAYVDRKNLLVTTPAFMGTAYLHEVFDGIGKMIQKVLQLADKK
ncbi:hypothetical protein HELRODRAFT_114003 [Helobdella robusta]|uniref:DJ-1/PfpI domain-containing protein n=1 Tax=Helobdella robusta TaxID=6412 RepID=T1EFY1_HELRO|nr:hypothetical protein HELRODRAFT_114003 [Helobdella robusta]ESN98109.1 hypothetical protein HELRODRAFT_114003 [Helobdella robusta]